MMTGMKETRLLCVDNLDFQKKVYILNNNDKKFDFVFNECNTIRH